MQDTVIPCPHCHGTGEIRGSWWIVIRLQDGQDYYGPFETREAAEQEVPQYKSQHGYWITEVVFRQESP